MGSNGLFYWFKEHQSPHSADRKRTANSTAGVGARYIAVIKFERILYTPIANKNANTVNNAQAAEDEDREQIDQADSHDHPHHPTASAPLSQRPADSGPISTTKTIDLRSTTKTNTDL